VYEDKTLHDYCKELSLVSPLFSFDILWSQFPHSAVLQKTENKLYIWVLNSAQVERGHEKSKNNFCGKDVFDIETWTSHEL
jgi:hypothetical protein